MKKLIGFLFIIILPLSLSAEDKPFPETENDAVEYAAEQTAEDHPESRKSGVNLGFFGLTIVEAGTRVFDHDAFSGMGFSSLGVIIASYGCYLAFNNSK
ncbi:MAG: hypothetical protein OXB86_03495 [Bdellovibrionales bacterium]|nr:hypothetical protein [Bdellovibrionales bacterium]